MNQRQKKAINIVNVAFMLIFILIIIFTSIAPKDKSDEISSIKLSGSKTVIIEKETVLDKPREIPIGKFEDDNQRDKDKDNDDKDEDEEPPEITPPPTEEEEEEIIPTINKIKLASFNAQIFGKSKWEKLGGGFYVNLIEDYDIFILQEIREKDEDSYNSLCSLLQSDYDCVISARAGRTSSKEQIAVFYKDNIDLESSEDIDDPSDIFEREPFKLVFDIDGYELIIWTTHIKPSDVENEMNELENLVNDEGNVIVIGDLNLDCSYDDGSNGDFEEWNYLIEDDEDTTVSSTDCAYDRIIMNDDSFDEYSDHGIDNSITSEESDHYLVWVEIGV